MANDNDKKIKGLLTAIESKKKGLGTKPKPQWKTNGVLKIGSESGININTINSTDKCVWLVSQLLQEMSFAKEACKFLGLPEQDSKHLELFNDALDDLKLRTQIVVWEAEKKKLQGMEAKVKDLRSTDAKTEDALADIAASLG
jgi:hypothetical protein